MRTLYHLWMSPFCRKARIFLGEKRLEHELRIENIWERREEFLALNPAGSVPVLVEIDGTAISGADVICEFLDEVHDDPPLIGRTPVIRAEVRRLTNWFDEKFNREVTDNLVGEKLLKRFLGQGEPKGARIRAGHANIHMHLNYLSFLIERRRWLAGDDFSMADVAAAAHLSCVDYLGDVPWEDHPEARDWYARIKSRPSMRSVLSDRMPGFPPPRHYADLDF
ncbi:MAG: glutathione S-transferase family protein [Rhodospirillales bacterium]|tara:strand:+ start:55 stop:723 length:669 start_codon:yes stop_codon:yes gene_type:complete